MNTLYADKNNEKKNSSNFAKTTEENLRKELENILLQVYIEHINKTKNLDMKRFEKHVKNKSNVNINFRLIFVQTLSIRNSTFTSFSYLRRR